MSSDSHNSTDYDFSGVIARPVLENYLSRAISMQGLSASPQLDDDLRMLENVGAKFLGRAAHLWGQVPADQNEQHFELVRKMVDDYQVKDSATVFQGCIFEAVFDKIVSGITIPEWVFEEFDLPMEHRTFNYEAMLYDETCARQDKVKWCPHPGNNYMRSNWGDGGSVPDMSKTETQMWFYYRGRRYIDAGIEALHMGQLHLMDHNDLQYEHWWSMLERIRKYGKQKARRGMVVIDAHTHGAALADGRLLFDFHTYPMHIREIPEKPQQGELLKGFRHSIYGNSLGCVTPSGWSCDSLPFLVEFDNWGPSGHPGELLNQPNWIWGYDEINWFAAQPEDYRNEFLRYAWNRVPELDPNGRLQMPGGRNLQVPVHDGRKWYFANTQSEAAPTGFNQEETIKEIWNQERLQ